MLRILDDAIELVRRLKPYQRRIAQGDRAHAKQLRDAYKSIPANLSEGAGRSGGNRRQLYRVALGSARETHTHLQVAVADELIDPVDPLTADLLDEVIATLVKLAR